MNSDNSAASGLPGKLWSRETGMSEATWTRLVELSRKQALVQSIRQLMNPLTLRKEQAPIKLPAKVAEMYRNCAQLPMRGFAKEESSTSTSIGEVEWAEILDADERRLAQGIRELMDSLAELAKTVTRPERSL